MNVEKFMHPHEFNDIVVWGSDWSLVKRIHHKTTCVTLSHFASGPLRVPVEGVSLWVRGLRVKLGGRWDTRRWISRVSSYTRVLCRGGSEPWLAGSSRPPWGCRSTRSTGDNWLSRCWDGASQTWSPVRAIIPTSLEPPPFSGAA